jgi:hypothetical protein
MFDSSLGAWLSLTTAYHFECSGRTGLNIVLPSGGLPGQDPGFDLWQKLFIAFGIIKHGGTHLTLHNRGSGKESGHAGVPCMTWMGKGSAPWKDVKISNNVLSASGTSTIVLLNIDSARDLLQNMHCSKAVNYVCLTWRANVTVISSVMTEFRASASGISINSA